jgi:hypothetical protein
MRIATTLASIVFGLTLAGSSPAASQDATAPDAKAHAARARHGHHAPMQFPMKAADFKQHVDAKLAKKRTHMEARASKLPADQAKEVRAKFDTGVAKVQQEVAAATADGTVTADEAKKVRDAMHALRPHRAKR